jgi:myo-inositol-1(or 4)-monophosphatase
MNHIDSASSGASDDARWYLRLRELAVEVASEAAHFVASHRPAVDQIGAKSSITDLVTDVDRASERRLVDAIQSRRPQDLVLGEEAGQHVGRRAAGLDESGREPVQWVIDPIDGTVNFVLGLPMYSVSVAARYQGVTVAGCVVDAVRSVAFHASLGGGSAVTDARGTTALSGPRPVPLNQAIVGTGFSYDTDVRRRQGAVVAAVITQIGNLRRLGSAALDLCFVASGQLDGYYEAGLADWDRAAGMLIASEAGALVGPLPGSTLSDTVVAAGPVLFDALTSVLVQAGAHNVRTG